MKTIQNLTRCAGVIAGLLLALHGPSAPAQPDAVLIPDPELQDLIRDTLGKPTGDITVADMESLTALDASVATRGAERPAIASLAGLEAARNLRSLNFAGSVLWWMGTPDPTVLTAADLSPLSALSHLGSLDLSSYATTNAHALGVLSGLTNLHTLVLQDTVLARSPMLGSLTTLRSLDLSAVEPSDDFTGDALSWFPGLASLANLEVLRLAGHGVTSLSFLEGLTALRHLVLEVHHQIADVSLPPALSGLRKLHLGGGFRSLTLPGNWDQLETLDVSGNQLTDLSFVTRLPSLRVLNVSYNRLGTFPPALTNLVQLSLGGNPISDVAFLGGMLGLEEFDFLGTPFKPADLELLRRLPKLRRLRLDLGMATTAVFPEGFDAVEALTVSGRLQGIVLVGLPRLRQLHLGGNLLVTADLGGARSSLEHVDLSYNRLQNVNFLAGFRQLRTLDMYGHELSALRLPEGLVNLRELILWDSWPEPPSPAAAPSSPGLHLKIVPPRPSPYMFLGLPASIDLRRLVIHGFPKERVTILGSWVHPPVRHDDGGITLRVRGARGRTAQVERSANLVDWAPWRTAVLDQLGEAEVTDDPSSTGVHFYRVRLPAE